MLETNQADAPRKASAPYRVAVTGCGVVSAIGLSFEAFAASVREGRSGVRRVALDGPGAVAAYVPSEDLPSPRAKEQILFDPVTRFAMLAGTEALEQSGLPSAYLDTAGVYMGCAYGGGHALEEAHRGVWYLGEAPHPLTLQRVMANAPASSLSIEYRMHGPNYTFSVGGASSSIAIGEAYLAIRAGRLHRAVAGGAEACVTPVNMRTWDRARLLASADAVAPQESCRPFARTRTGTVLGEGACVLVLERLDQALERGANVLCELLGFGTYCDASQLATPSENGRTEAMIAALTDAGLSASDIDYVNAHGDATRIGDLTEVHALQNVFGERAEAQPVSSTKAIHGNLIGAAGALEFAACIAALRGQFLPPTMHLSDFDSSLECGLDFIPGVARPGVRIDRVMSNSFSTGGSNAVLVAGRVG